VKSGAFQLPEKTVNAGETQLECEVSSLTFCFLLSSSQNHLLRRCVLALLLSVLSVRLAGLFANIVSNSLRPQGRVLGTFIENIANS